MIVHTIYGYDRVCNKGWSHLVHYAELTAIAVAAGIYLIWVANYNGIAYCCSSVEVIIL